MISQELYQEILNSCGLSQAMKEHLEKQDLSKHDLIKLLVNAPVALTKKLTLMEQIAETEDLYEEMLEQVNRLLPGEKGHLREWQSVWSRSATRIKGEIQRAIDALQVDEGEFFWMEEHWFDYEWLDEKNSGGRAFQSLDAALQAIRDMMQEEEWDEATEFKFENPTKKMRHARQVAIYLLRTYYDYSVADLYNLFDLDWHLVFRILEIMEEELNACAEVKAEIEALKKKLCL